MHLYARLTMKTPFQSIGYHYYLAIFIIVMSGLWLTGCINSDDEGTGSVTLSLQFTDNGLEMPDGIRIAGNKNVMSHCVVEVFRSGDSDNRLLRREFYPTTDTDGKTTLNLELDEGAYDFMIWCDGPTDNKSNVRMYDTGTLYTVRHSSENYSGNFADRDAVCAFVTNIAQDCTDRETVVEMHRPLAGYCILTNDLEAYEAARAKNPERIPPVGDLRFRVSYEFFCPSAFNVSSDMPNDSKSGMGYIATARTIEGLTGDGELMIASDMVFTTDQKSSVTLTLEVMDKNDKIISRSTGLKVECRRGMMTVIKSDFLSLGIASGGIRLDTEWKEDIIIPLI